jgi:hypothetical protein
VETRAYLRHSIAAAAELQSVPRREHHIQESPTRRDEPRICPIGVAEARRPPRESPAPLRNTIVTLDESLEPTSEAISILEQYLAKPEAGVRLNPEDLLAR